LNGQTINLTQGFLDLSGANSDWLNPGVITIDGGGQITVNGNGLTSVFKIEGGVNALIEKPDRHRGQLFVGEWRRHHGRSKRRQRDGAELHDQRQYRGYGGGISYRRQLRSQWLHDHREYCHQTMAAGIYGFGLIENSTITNNVATTGGGGIAAVLPMDVPQLHRFRKQQRALLPLPLDVVDSVINGNAGLALDVAYNSNQVMLVNTTIYGQQWRH